MRLGRRGPGPELFARTPRIYRQLLTVLVVVAALRPSRAEAYSWMIRHDYSQCVPCHVDPSGSGPLSPYGRVLGEELLRTPYGTKAEGEEEGGSAGEFLWGAVPLPEQLLLGGDLRLMHMRRKIENTKLVREWILMQADLEATVMVGKFIASGSLGYAHEGGLGAALTRGPKHNLVSRQHWLGCGIGDSVLVRAGRMNLPFGVRNVEHTLWARDVTRTSIQDDQQHGVAASFSGEAFRGELMGILGNFQLRPDDFRERGYSGYLEWLATPKLAIGASSLIAHAKYDTRLVRETWRHAHGVFARWATDWRPLVLLTEWDYSLLSPKDDEWREGVVGYLQADLEIVQGIHLIATGEAQNVGINSPPASWGAWLSYAWFFAPHADLRFDGVYQSLGSDSARIDSLSLLIQGHVYL
jgi:hypothetical protein